MDASTDHESSTPAQSGQTKATDLDQSFWEDLSSKVLAKAIARSSNQTRKEVARELKKMLENNELVD
jgi:hypothetical protein